MEVASMILFLYLITGTHSECSCSNEMSTTNNKMQGLEAKLARQEEMLNQLKRATEADKVSTNTQLRRHENVIARLSASATYKRQSNNNIHQMFLQVMGRLFTLERQVATVDHSVPLRCDEQNNQNAESSQNAAEPSSQGLSEAVDNRNQTIFQNTAHKILGRTIEKLQDTMDLLNQKLEEHTGRIQFLEEAESNHTNDIKQQTEDINNKLDKHIQDQEQEGMILKANITDVKKQTVDMDNKLDKHLQEREQEGMMLKTNITDIKQQTEDTNNKLDKHLQDQEQQGMMLQTNITDIRQQTVDINNKLYERMQDHQQEGMVLKKNITDIKHHIVDINNTLDRHIQDQEQREIILKKITDCTELFGMGYRRTGVYWIKPTSSSHPVKVRCEMSDGGWTVLMRRYDGSVDFYRTWAAYKHGFGSPATEHWLGNDKINLITKQKNYKLRVEFTTWFTNTSYYADYQVFRVHDEAHGYRLTIDSFSGNATVDALKYHNQQRFSTRDRDNDAWSRHCAQVSKGGWWYRACSASQLTGRYQASCGDATCMYWYNRTPLRAATMKVKPV